MRIPYVIQWLKSRLIFYQLEMMRVVEPMPVTAYHYILAFDLSNATNATNATFAMVEVDAIKHYRNKGMDYSVLE